MASFKGWQIYARLLLDKTLSSEQIVWHELALGQGMGSFGVLRVAISSDMLQGRESWLGKPGCMCEN